MIDERKLEKVVAPSNGFMYRLIDHRLLRDGRSRKISEGVVEKRETQLEGVETRKGK